MRKDLDYDLKNAHLAEYTDIKGEKSYATLGDKMTGFTYG